MIAKEKLKDILKQNIVTISFKKVDGTDRKMLCSLKEELLPPNDKTEENGKKKAENENILPVWDIEKEAFRSFRIDSLTDYEVLKEGYEL